jgi:hypothetical protein
MAPMIVLVIVALIARIFTPWRDAVRVGMAASVDTTSRQSAVTTR